MMFTHVCCQDGDEDIITYRDQGVSTEEHDKATYSELTKTQSEEEEEIKYNVVLCANDSVSLEKKRRQLNENTPNENVYNVNQSDISINGNTTVNSFNNEVTTVQGPTGDNTKIKLWKVWTMEMLMNNGDILMTMTNGLKQAREDCKKFLYARAIHKSHNTVPHGADHGASTGGQWIQKYDRGRKGFDFFGVKSIQSDPAVISHIIHMIEVDNFWPQKTFEAVLASLQRN